MAIQREEHYCDIGVAHCVVTNCVAPIVAEVFDGDYAIALEMFRGIRRARMRTRRVGDEHFYVCQRHLDHEERMARLRWQKLIFLGGTDDRLRGNR